MTDEQIDALIDANRENLKISLRDLLNGIPAHLFTFADGTNSGTGVKTKITCILAHEICALVLEGTLDGLGKSQERFAEIMRQSELSIGGGIIH